MVRINVNDKRMAAQGPSKPLYQNRHSLARGAASQR